MAEYTFQEVVKQRERLCRSNKDCSACPLDGANNGTQWYCSNYTRYRPAEAERIIMDWAAKHPEPKYPTWKEWQKKMFPAATSKICKVHCGLRCDMTRCDICLDTPIPPDIAAKLGIDPVRFSEKATEGGGDDGN